LFDLAQSDHATLWRAVVHNRAGTTTSALVGMTVCDADRCTTPGPPTIVQDATAGDRAATVSWTPPAHGAAPITGYVVTPYVGFAPSRPQTFESAATTQVVGGLRNGVTYRFRVQAVLGSQLTRHSKATNAVTPIA
jgi:hypothetical protein